MIYYSGQRGLSDIAVFIRILRPTCDCAMGKFIVEQSVDILANCWIDMAVLIIAYTVGRISFPGSV